MQELTQSHIDEYKFDVFLFLGKLRQSGVTNMLGATPFIMEEFDFPSATATKWLTKWITEFEASDS